MDDAEAETPKDKIDKVGYLSALRRRGSKEPLTTPESQLPCGQWLYHKARRNFEVLAEMPTFSLGYLFIVTALPIVTVIATAAIRGEDRAAWTCLAVVYGVFQWVYGVHALYAQNEYTLVASLTLLATQAIYVTLDYTKDYTGRGIGVGWVAVAWTAFGLGILLAWGSYWKTDGMTWRAFRDVGTLAEHLQIHMAYRRFSAALKCDLMGSLMSSTLVLVFIDWTPSVPPVAICIAVPLVGWYPLKQAVRGEERQQVKRVVLGYLVTVVLWGVGLGWLVFMWASDKELHVKDHERLSGKGKNFPTSPTLVAAITVAVILRLVLFRTIRECVRAFGTGLLKRLHVVRRREREAGRPAGGAAFAYDYITTVDPPTASEGGGTPAPSPEILSPEIGGQRSRGASLMGLDYPELSIPIERARQVQ